MKDFFTLITLVISLWIPLNLQGQPDSSVLLPRRQVLAAGQPGVAHLRYLLMTSDQSEEIKVEMTYQKLDELVAGLTFSDRKNDHQRVLKLVFEQGRRNFLHLYDKNYPHFSSIFSEGRYNCVTGTAMYAWVLLRMGYEIRIHETARHAYLTIHTDDNVYLMDATDAENGFVVGAVNVGKRKLWYTGNELQKGQSFQRVITFEQLCGLQYYNQGVVQFNGRHYNASLVFLRKAAELYPQSGRINNLIEAASGQRAEIMSFPPAGMVVTASNTISKND